MKFFVDLNLLYIMSFYTWSEMTAPYRENVEWMPNIATVLDALPILNEKRKEKKNKLIIDRFFSLLYQRCVTRIDGA